jgi:ribose-phosphate pyrophosphokinase
MKYLNLSSGFNPCNAEAKDIINFKSFFFKGGEPHIKINTFYSTQKSVTITCRINNMKDFGMLMVAVEALLQIGWVDEHHLFIPYFPGARQDRRMVPGEPLTVRVFADIINRMNFDSVRIFDPHSEVTPALLKNCDVIDNHKFVKACVNEITRIDATDPKGFNMWGKEFHLVSPDAGANKKITSVAIALEANSIVKCDKTRDVTNGSISGFEVYSDDLEGKDAIIIDDICDGGGTFIGLADELRKKNAGKLHLVVSHGIFSKGFEELEQVFETIWYTDSINTLYDFYSDFFINEKRLQQIKISL